MIKNFNDLLALIVLVGIIPGLWILLGMGVLSVSGQVEGALIMAWGLVLQYYFRRKPPPDNQSKDT